MNTQNTTQISTAASENFEARSALMMRRNETSNVMREEFNNFIQNIRLSSGSSSNSLFNEILSSLKTKSKSIYDINQLSKAFESLLIKKEDSKRYGKTNWTEIETSFLISIVAHYCHYSSENFRSLGDKDWQYLEAIFPTKQVHQIIKRWMIMFKSDLGQNPWTHQEDEQLKALVAELGTGKKWKQIAEKINSSTKNNVFRQPRQCRERWINYIDPNINRGDWSKEEDIKLMRSFLSVGKRWSDISEIIGNRTENAVKNRFNSLIKKEVLKGECLDENLSYKDEASEIKVVNRLIERLTSDHFKKIQQQTAKNTTTIQNGPLFNQLIDKKFSNYRMCPQQTLTNQLFCSPFQNYLNCVGYYNLPAQDLFNKGIFSNQLPFFDARRTEVPQTQQNLKIMTSNQANYMPIQSGLSTRPFKLSIGTGLEFSKEVAKAESRIFFAMIDINKNRIQILDKFSTNN